MLGVERALVGRFVVSLLISHHVEGARTRHGNRSCANRTLCLRDDATGDEWTSGGIKSASAAEPHWISVTKQHQT